VAVLALGALAASGNAQTVYQGKFTLPFETHWGGVKLSPGDYTFVIPSTSYPYLLYIQGQGGNAIIMVSAVDKYKAGLVDFLSVLDAQRDLYANEDQLVQSQTSVTTNLVGLYRALGGGWNLGRTVATSKSTP
jgi:hypothetical protein